MYVVAPALPAPYKWLNVPLRALTADRWPGYIPSWSPSNMDSFHVMFPSELREILLRNPALKHSSQWSMAILATATVVTSAMAIYYYAQYNGYETNISQLISSLSNQESSWASFSLSMFQEQDSDDEPYDDDDEHVDAELMDGFEKNMRSGSLSVRLVSADPTSQLSYAPIHMDLCRGKTSRVSSQDPLQRKDLAESLVSPFKSSSILKRESQSFSSQLLCDPRTLYELPRHRRRMARHLIHDPWDCLSPPPVALKDYFTTTDNGTGVVADEQVLASRRESANLPLCKAIDRKVAFKEPDWVPYIDTHGRARQRAVVAILARTIMDTPSGSSTPSTPAEEIGKDIFMQTLPTVSPEELGDGAEFWFERFTRATAAGGKHWDFRRRQNEPAEHFNSNIFDELLTPENVRMKCASPVPSLPLSRTTLDSDFTSSSDSNDSHMDISASTARYWKPSSVLAKRKHDIECDNAALELSLPGEKRWTGTEVTNSSCV